MITVKVKSVDIVDGDCSITEDTYESFDELLSEVKLDFGDVIEVSDDEIKVEGDVFIITYTIIPNGIYVESIDVKALAEFVEEGLTGLGILDDADEILACYFDDGGMKSVKTAQKHYNNAIAFVNETLDDHDRTLSFITDEEVSDWFE